MGISRSCITGVQIYSARLHASEYHKEGMVKVISEGKEAAVTGLLAIGKIV
jgi:hypothetical protein